MSFDPVFGTVSQGSCYEYLVSRRRCQLASTRDEGDATEELEARKYVVSDTALFTRFQRFQSSRDGTASSLS